MSTTRKDEVLAAAIRLVAAWRSLVTAHVPIKPDHPPSAIVLFAGIAGPLDELDRLVGDGKFEPERQRWEYKFVEMPRRHNGRWAESPEEVLAQLDAEGWELCAVDFNTNNFILKRPRR
jgi:hypothetical protein